MLIRTLSAAAIAAAILALATTSSDASQAQMKCGFAGETTSRNGVARLHQRGELRWTNGDVPRSATLR